MKKESPTVGETDTFRVEVAARVKYLCLYTD